MSLTIKDVWKFIKNQPKTSSENLLIWLNTFNFYDQLCFIDIITKYRILKTTFYPSNLNFHIPCKCKDVYLNLPESFSKKYSNITFFEKCITDKIEIEHDIIQVSFINQSKQLTKDTIIRYNKEIRSKAKTFKAHENVTADLFYTESDKFLIECKNKNKFKNYDYSIPLYYLLKYPLEKLLPYINILELYTIYILKYVFSMRDFELLIPEYWRSLNRAIYNSKKSSPLTILSTIYNFYSGSLILSQNTYTKATFKLGTTVEVESFNDLLLSDYIIQPYFSGLRVLICKNTSNKIIVRNKNNIKIKLNSSLLSKINQDNTNTFTGEFIIMLYNNITCTWHSKTDLIEYLMSDVKSINFNLRFYILDLLVWNTVNLSSVSYEQRQLIIKNFLETFQHYSLFLPLPENLTIESLNENFKTYIKQGENLRPPFTGILLRKKHVNYNTQLIYTKYNLQKYLIHYKYSTSYFTVEPGKSVSCKQGRIITPLYNNSKFILTFICFSFEPPIMKLAIFENREYRHFMNIDIRLLNLINILTFANTKIQIKDVEYKATMVTIGFNKLYDEIDFIIPSPDKSLIDCVNYNQLKDYVKINFLA